MGIPDAEQDTELLLYASQEATVRTRHGTTDWFQIGRGVHQGCILLLCLFSLYAGQEATVRTAHGTTDWFQIGKGVCQGCILSPCLFTSMQSTSYKMLGWMKHKLESRLLGKISTSDMQMTPLLWQKAKRN